MGPIHSCLEPFLLLIIPPLNHIKKMAAINTARKAVLFGKRLGSTSNIDTVFKDGHSPVHIPVIDKYSPIFVRAAQSSGMFMERLRAAGVRVDPAIFSTEETES